MVVDRTNTGTSTGTSSIDNRTNTSNYPPKSGWSRFMHIVDTCNIDTLLSCDENCSIPVQQRSQNNMGTTARLTGGSRIADSQTGNKHHQRQQQQLAQPQLQQQVLDEYAQRHDSFLDSLLYEQVHLRRTPQHEVDNVIDPIRLSSSVSTNTTHSDGGSMHSAISDMSGSKPDRKASFSVRLKRRTQSSPCRSVSSAPSVVEADAKISIDRSRTFELDTISDAGHHPSGFVHPNCRIQKDSGKGDEAGTKVCAKGRDQCLDKLRMKMKLLTEHAMPIPGESKKGPATMKRRNAKVWTNTSTFVETRSMIELRMGFLSMTYGILLRWDYNSSKQIDLIVLRKSCHEAFYPKDSLISPIKTIQPVKNTNVVTPTSETSKLTLLNGTIDPSNLRPPYRVPRPDVFRPKFFQIKVLYAIGLHPRSTWTVQLVRDTRVEIIKLKYNLDSCCYIPKGTNGVDAKFPMYANIPSFDVQLLEQRPRRKHQRRLVGTMSIPTTDPTLQSATIGKPVRLRIPCQHDPAASIQLEMSLSSDYDAWLKQEIAARRLEEAKRVVEIPDSKANSAMTSSTTASHIRPMDIVDENASVNNMNNRIDAQNDDRWDWICCIC